MQKGLRILLFVSVKLCCFVKVFRYMLVLLLQLSNNLVGILKRRDKSFTTKFNCTKLPQIHFNTFFLFLVILFLAQVIVFI